MAVKWKVPLDKDGNVMRTVGGWGNRPDREVEPYEFNGEVKFLRLGEKYSDSEWFIVVSVVDDAHRRTAYSAPMFMREFGRALEQARPSLGGYEATFPNPHRWGGDKRPEHTTQSWGLLGRWGFRKQGANISLTYLGPEVY